MPEQVHVQQSTRFYRPQLDVVRFLAFLAVFWHHSLPRDGAHSKWLKETTNAMGFGLCLFFVLSAYLIALLLQQERQKTNTIALRAFYIRRVLRIWPLYFLGLALAAGRAVSHGLLHAQREWLVAALLFAGNLVPHDTAMMNHLWSISVEEQFYLFFPSCCKWLGQRAMLLCAGVLIITANLALVYSAHHHADLNSHVWSNSLVQFEMFAAGILLAVFDRWLPQWTWQKASTAAGVALALLAFAELYGSLKLEGALAMSAWKVCSGYFLVALGCALLIVAVQRLPAPAPFVYSGKISYGLYVFHAPILSLIVARVPALRGGIALSLATTYCVAALSYRYFETPFLRLKRRFEIVSTRTTTAP